MLSLPCHRQKGGCELFQFSKPGHTLDEEEKRKKESSQTYRSIKAYGVGSLFLAVADLCLTNRHVLWVSAALLPTFLHLYGVFIISCLCYSHWLSDGEGKEERVLYGSFYSHPGQEATHPDLHSPRQNFMLLSENPKILIYIWCCS